MRGRLLGLLAVLVTWSVVDRLVRARLRWDEAPGPFDLLSHVGAQLLLPAGELWFIWTLLVMMVLARALARARWLLLVLALLLLARVVPLPDLGVQTEAAFTAGPYLLVGALLGRAPLRALSRAGWPVWVPSVAFFLLLVALSDRDLLQGVPEPVETALLVVCGSTALLTTALLLQRWRVTGPLARLGRRTLPVYVMHLPLALVLLRWVDEREWTSVVAAHPYAALLLVVALGVTVPVLLDGALRRLDVHGVFDAPRCAIRVLDRLLPPATGAPARGRPPAGPADDRTSAPGGR